MKTTIITLCILLFGFYGAHPKKEITVKTYYYYIETTKKTQNSDYSYDVIFSEVKSANCDWDDTSKYGYGRDAIDFIAMAFDEWFGARYSDSHNYNTGFDAIGNKRLYTSRSDAESARNKAMAEYRNSDIKYNIKYDNGFNYICR